METIDKVAAETTSTATENVVVTDGNATQENATTAQQDAVQSDIERMEDLVAQLKETGGDLCKDEIASLEAKLEEMKAAAAAALEEAVNDVKEAEQTFIQKYGSDIVESAKIAALLLLLGKAFGAF